MNLTKLSNFNSVSRETIADFRTYTADMGKQLVKLSDDLKVNKPNLKKKEKIQKNRKFRKVVENKLIGYNIEHMLGEIELYKIYPNIYCVKIEDSWLRALLFLRYQEYYEGFSDDFRGKNWEVQDYIRWYKEYYKNDIFSYGDDWAGFNIPSESIENCIKGIKNFNYYDLMMRDIINVIESDCHNEKFYLLGVDSIDNPDYLTHEFAHGIFYTDTNYTKEMTNLVNQLPVDIHTFLDDKLSDIGYAHTVYIDEIQAYMSTGLIERMLVNKELVNYIGPFEKVFKKYYKPTISKMEIKWVSFNK